MSNQGLTFSDDILPSSSTSNNLNVSQIDIRAGQTYSQYRSLVLAALNSQGRTSSENNLRRLQNLRKELNYISETDWMYEAIDKKPMQ